LLGTKSTIDAIKNGEAKLVVVAANCPQDEHEDIERYAQLSGIRIREFSGTSWDLGEVIGRPHMVAAIAILEPGDSNILELA
jgi:large subunit ribosomal protein L30e